MAHDSRRWTGRYAPGEMPPEFAGGRPYRRRWVRWMLVGIIAATAILSIGQIWLPEARDTGLPLAWPLAFSAIGAAVGLSPFARGPLLLHATAYDEFERAALLRAGAVGYVVILMLGCATLAYCAMAAARGWPMPRHMQDWLAWALGLLVIGSNLPATLAEFAIPFPVEEDAA